MKVSEATILVVDDEPELLDIFSTWLRRSGGTVLTAVNGAEALKILTVTPIDALVSDIRMPIMDGVTLVRKLFELGIHIPSIIFVSGFSDVDPRDVYALGVEALLAKPLSRQQFMQALESCLKDRGELWLEPIVGEPHQALNLSFASLATARLQCEFDLGRGGCCVTTPAPLKEDTPIAFSISFGQEKHILQGQGIVRWYRPRIERTGIEFTYLDPTCRPWVLEIIQSEASHCFIPTCANPVPA